MDNEIKIGVEIASHPDNRNDNIITFYKEGDNCVIEIGGHAQVGGRVQVTLAQLRAMMNVIDAQKSQLFRNIETLGRINGQICRLRHTILLQSQITEMEPCPCHVASHYKQSHLNCVHLG